MFNKNTYITIMIFLLAMVAVAANPVIDSINDLTVNESTTTKLEVSYTAADNGTITVTDNSTLVAVGSPGTTSTNLTITTDYTSAGTYDILVNVSDGNSSTSDVFTLTVNNINRAPTLSDFTSQTITQGFSKTVNLSAHGTDVDNDALTYSVTSSDENKIKCTVAGDVLTLEANATYSGDSTCNVTVTDANSATASKLISATSNVQNPVVTLTQSPNPAELTLYSDGNLRKATFKVTLTEAGNMPLSNINVDFDDFIGTTHNISFTGNDYIVSSIDDGSSNEREFTVTLPSIDFGVGTYNAKYNVTYHGKSTTGNLVLSLKTPVSSLKTSPASEFVLGSTSQERGRMTSPIKLTLTNDGDFTLSNFIITSTADAKHKVNFSLTSSGKFKNSIDYSTDATDAFSIASGKTKDIYVQGFISNSTSSEKIDIGDILIQSSGANLTLNLFSQAENKLKLERVKADSETLTDNEDTSDYKPGEKVDFSVKVENLYSSSEDLKIEDIDVKVTISSIDDGDDIELETSSSFDLRDGNDKTVNFDFIIPYYAEEGTFDILIEVDGKDENGASHFVTQKNGLVVDKRDDEVSITRAELGNDELQCIRTTTLDVQITNTGSDDQDEVTLKIKSNALGIDVEEKELDLEANSVDDGSYRRSVTILADDNLKPGTYPIDISTFYSNTISSKTGRVNLIVKDCELNTKDDTGSTGSSVVVKTTAQPQLPPSTSGQVFATASSTQDESFKTDNLYLTLLILLNVLAVVGIVFLGYKFL